MKLIFLDGFSGETVGQLLALEETHRIDSLVLAFEQAIAQKAAREGSESLTIEEQTVLAVEALEREVNNGGYLQFFVNSSVEFAPIIVGALRRIGCPSVAAITESAISALRVPALSVGAIQRVIDDDDDIRDKVLGECDGRYFECRESIEDRLFSFIKANKSKIDI
ncbi:MAG: DUF4375 domain-containing protein [Phycisphaerales bacterium]|nr:DUF4375 domain-containing protein [Phycisphaerales bacterium]